MGCVLGVRDFIFHSGL